MNEGNKPYCKDCRFFIPNNIAQYATGPTYCKASRYLAEDDPVYGPIYRYRTCDIARAHEKFCGKSGKWFEEAGWLRKLWNNAG